MHAHAHKHTHARARATRLPPALAARWVFHLKPCGPEGIKWHFMLHGCGGGAGRGIIPLWDGVQGVHCSVWNACFVLLCVA